MSSPDSPICCGLSDSGGCQQCLARAGITEENTDKHPSENTDAESNKLCAVLHVRITASHSALQQHPSLQYHRAPSPTCGGGSPPAPGGHTGSIFLIFSLLHSQDGEGFSMLQLPFKKMSRTESGTEAVVHSICPTVQGVSLCQERGKANAVFRTTTMVFAYKPSKYQTPQSPEEAGCSSMQPYLTELNSSEQQTRLCSF